MTRLRPHGMLALLAAPLALIAPRLANADEPIKVGTMTVQRYGDHGKPLILIPGLASGGWVWDGVVEKLKSDHVLYVVTLAGFDGVAPVQGKLMDLANNSLLELIRSQHLDKPVLIGHSLGGTLSIQFAESHSDLISAVVAVDGLPVLPGTENIPADRRAPMVETIRQQMATWTPPQFKAQQLRFMQNIGVVDQAKAAELAERTARSDPAATAEYMAEDFTLDLRPGLASIKVPVLEISPYNADDFAKAGTMTEPQKTAYYTELLKGTPSLQVVSIASSRHFVMFDQPDAFAAALQQFLANDPPKATSVPTTKPAASVR